MPVTKPGAVVVEPLFSWTALRGWYRVLQVAICLPMLLAVISFVRAGFYPINDDAYSAMSAWDLYTGHWPTQGAHSTSAMNTGIEVHHPGPLFYYLLAPFLLLGKGGAPLVIGQATIATGCALGALSVARRLGGAGLATAVTAAWIACGAQLGGELYARPFPPYPSVVVLPLLLLSTWGLLRERLWLLPAWVFALSLSVQPHLGNVPLAAVLVFVVSCVALVRWRRRRGVLWPRRGWRSPSTRNSRRHFAWAVLLAVVLWIPSLIELITRSPNNARQFVVYLLADTKEPTVGIANAAPLTLNIATGWQSAHARGTDLLFGNFPSPWAVPVFIGAIAAVAVLALPWWARSYDRARAVHLCWWAGLLDLALVVYTIGLAQLDARGFIDWEYVQLPMLWPLVWATLAVELWWVLRLLHAAGELPATTQLARPVEALRRWANGSRLASAVNPRQIVLVGTAVVFSMGVLLIPGAPEGSLLTTGRNVQHALPAIERAVERLGGQGASVELAGHSIGSSYDVGWALGYGLIRDGYHPHISTFGSLPEYWDYRKYTTTPKSAVRVYVRQDGPLPQQVSPGTRPDAVFIGGPELTYQVYVFRTTN